MEIKSYRAATLREALMQIKEELGEDALVLETKQVHAGGFLGVGGRDLIEVRVAPSRTAPAGKGAAKAPKPANSGKLNLTEDSAALPVSAKERAKERAKEQANERAREMAKQSARQTAQDSTEAADMDFLTEVLNVAKAQPKISKPIWATKGSSQKNAAAAAPKPETQNPASKDDWLSSLGLGKAEKPSAPAAGSVDEKQALGAFAALAARAFLGQDEEHPLLSRPPRDAAKRPARPAVEHQHQRVELAETAPRIVHRRTAAAAAATATHRKPAAKPATLNATPAGEPVLPRTVSTELARLRAEMREMKFALGALQSRPAPPREWQALNEFENDPALYDSPNYETFLALRGAGVSADFAKQAVRQAAKMNGQDVGDTHARARAALAAALPGWLPFAESALAMQEAAAFIGPTGVGKTTTIAKLAAHIALRARRRVELITLDTYRIAAIQQLKTYAEIIGAGCHVARSVVELDALTRRFAQQATVLIDTTGRSPHDLADQMELADYLRSNKALLKCLVLPATTQPEDGQLARDKFALYGVNRLVLTKLDETVQPGATVAVAALAKLPLMYLCAGQRVPEDLERATPASFAHRVLRPKTLASAA